MNTNEQAPECCPFCGAGIYILKNGKPCSDPEGSWSEFACGNQWHRGSENQRSLQTPTCATAERERLTRERDQALMMLGVYKMHKDELKARIKRLEEAGDAIVDHNIGCGCGHDGPCRACRMACEAWTKAKEATP